MQKYKKKFIPVTNNIISNGGGIADALINIHKPTVNVKVIKTNVDVLKTDNTSKDNSKVPFGAALEM